MTPWRPGHFVCVCARGRQRPPTTRAYDARDPRLHASGPAARTVYVLRMLPTLVEAVHDPRQEAKGRRRGMLVNGQWVERRVESDSSGGFVRPEQPFRHWLSKPGQGGEFPAEPGRYHLFVAGTCPWAHRTLVTRGVLGLEHAISVDSSDGQSSGGWQFSRGVQCSGFKEQFGNRRVYLHEIYSSVKPDATCIVTVPVLFDKKTRRIVSNESADIIRMINDTMQDLALRPHNLAPQSLLSQIDSINDFIYTNFNNGVYRAGFAQSREAHESAVHDVFLALDALETRLGRSRYLCGDSITEADVRLLPTCVRFDQSYYTAFGCSDRKLVDAYPNVLNWTRDMVQTPGIRETLDYQQYYHYFALASWFDEDAALPPYDAELFELPHGRAERGYGPVSARL